MSFEEESGYQESLSREVADLVVKYSAGHHPPIQQDSLEPGFGTVTVRNAEKKAYRDKSGAVWYFSGSGANLKTRARSIVAASFQAEEPK